MNKRSDTPKSEARKRAEIYRQAAKNIEHAKDDGFGNVTPCGCCEALGNVAPEGMDLESPFADIFRDEGVPTYWWGECICAMPETQGPRVIALCLMAAMVEAGDA